MSYKLDLSCDLGEAFGIYKLVDDEEIMKYITSCNVACGFHAGDPHVMKKTVQLAKKYGVQVGAHPGLPDMIGFGRRRIAVTPQEWKDYVIYQAGALNAFLTAHDMKLQHIFPHGITSAMCWEDQAYANALIEAITGLDKSKKIILSGGRAGPGLYFTMLYDLAKNAGLRVSKLLVLDMDYEPDGRLFITREHKPVDVDERVKRAIRMVKEGKIKDKNGNDMNYKADTILVHGDTPNVLDLLAALKREFPKEGIELVPLKEIV